MRTLAQGGYTPISADRLHEFMQGDGEVPGKPVVITFDCCLFDNWINAMPVLDEFGFKAVFFCITGFLHDTPKRTQKADSELLGRDQAFEQALCDKNFSGFMSRQEVYETVHSFGHEVYSASATYPMIFKSSAPKGTYPDKKHWCFHSICRRLKEGDKVYDVGSALAYNGYVVKDDKPVLRGMDERAKQCRFEMEESKKELEYLLARPCGFFSWPCGQYDRLSVSILEETGYKGAFTFDRGANARNTDVRYIKRIRVKGKRPLLWLRKRLGIYSNSIMANLFGRKFRLKI
ncbi:polysaccharide deacetylase family protein [Geovibrio thiophilus]|nr:polysaccharide deacetylase family protein [Geovibrio thiophilus]